MKATIEDLRRKVKGLVARGHYALIHCRFGCSPICGRTHVVLGEIYIEAEALLSLDAPRARRRESFLAAWFIALARVAALCACVSRPRALARPTNAGS